MQTAFRVVRPEAVSARSGAPGVWSATVTRVERCLSGMHNVASTYNVIRQSGCHLGYRRFFRSINGAGQIDGQSLQDTPGGSKALRELRGTALEYQTVRKVGGRTKSKSFMAAQVRKRLGNSTRDVMRRASCNYISQYRTAEENSCS